MLPAPCVYTALVQRYIVFNYFPRAFIKEKKAVEKTPVIFRDNYIRGDEIYWNEDDDAALIGDEFYRFHCMLLLAQLT